MRWPIGWRRLLLVFALAAGFAFALCLQFFSTAHGANDLRDVEVQLRQSVPYWAIPVGVVVAFAMQVHQEDSVVVGPAPGRPRARIVTSQLVSLSAAVGVGMLVGIAPVSVTLGVTQYATGSDVIWILASVAAVVSLVPIGALSSLLGGRLLGVVLSPIGILAATLVPALIVHDLMLRGRPASLLSTSYVWTVSAPGRGEMLVAQVGWLRIGFFLLVWFTTVLATQGVAEWHGSRSWKDLLSGFWLSIPIVVGAVVANLQPILVLPDPQDQVSCQSADNMQLCLYQIDEPSRAAIVDALRPVFPVLRVAGLETITQEYGSDGFQINRLAGSKTDWVDREIRSAVATAVGRPALPCETNPEPREIRDALSREILARGAAASQDPVVAGTYTRAAGEYRANGPAASSFAKLSDAQLYSWFATNKDAVASCGVQEADLP